MSGHRNGLCAGLLGLLAAATAGCGHANLLLFLIAELGFSPVTIQRFDLGEVPAFVLPGGCTILRNPTPPPSPGFPSELWAEGDSLNLDDPPEWLSVST